MGKKKIGKGLIGVRHKPRETFGSGFAAALVALSAEFLKSKQFKHAPTKGTEREVAVKNFLSAYLPATYAITTGEAVDLYDNRSSQLDIMIYDRLRNFPMFSGVSCILPVEALLVSIEVKTLLDLTATCSALESGRKLKNLLPFNRSTVLIRPEGEPADGRCRIFHCLFAYASDVTAPDWWKTEYFRIQKAIQEGSYSGHEIDRIYVANRGVIHPARAYGIAERPEAGNALMTFCMHILNFIQHENDRRDGVPYLHYAGKLRKGFRRLPKQGKQSVGRS